MIYVISDKNLEYQFHTSNLLFENDFLKEVVRVSQNDLNIDYDLVQFLLNRGSWKFSIWGAIFSLRVHNSVIVDDMWKHIERNSYISPQILAVLAFVDVSFKDRLKEMISTVWCSVRERHMYGGYGKNLLEMINLYCQLCGSEDELDSELVVPEIEGVLESNEYLSFDYYWMLKMMMQKDDT